MDETNDGQHRRQEAAFKNEESKKTFDSVILRKGEMNLNWRVPEQWLRTVHGSDTQKIPQ